jgi:hypothetical protein
MNDEQWTMGTHKTIDNKPIKSLFRDLHGILSPLARASTL